MKKLFKLYKKITHNFRHTKSSLKLKKYFIKHFHIYTHFKFKITFSYILIFGFNFEKKLVFLFVKNNFKKREEIAMNFIEIKNSQI
jgi:hypothetical protein